MVGTVSGRRQCSCLVSDGRYSNCCSRASRDTIKTTARGRVNAIILAEIGLKRLQDIGALAPWMLAMSAIRISDDDWPAAGQGQFQCIVEAATIKDFHN